MDSLAHKNSKNDDIDLVRLVIGVVNAFYRNFKLFIITVIIGSVSSIVYHSNSKPIYQTSILGSTSVLTNIQLENLIEVLNKLSKEGSALQLAKKLRVSPQLASTIQSIETKSIGDLTETKPRYQIARADSNIFEITLSTSDNQLLDSLQAGILYYLQQNNFVQKRVSIRKQNLEAMLGKVKEEQRKLDTLRFSVNKVLSKGLGGNSTMLMLDPGSVNKDIIALYEKELQIKSDLLLIDDIQVIQGFTQFSKPSSPQLLKNIVASTGIAIALALVLIVILEVRRGIKKFKEKTATEQVV